MKTYIELAKANVEKNRNIVISKRETKIGEQITLAQQVKIEDSGIKTTIFLKGAIHLGKDALYNLRDALNEAIMRLEAEQQNEPI